MTYSINQSKFLSDAELSKLTTTLESIKSTRPRDYLILSLLIHTGGRASEILIISHDSLRPTDKSVYVIGLKGSNDREIPLPDSLYEDLEHFSKQNQDDDLFPITLRRLDQVWREIRPCNKSLHSLRHTFAINLYKRTKDLRLVQLALGHRDIKSTMVYASYLYSKEEFRRILIPA